MRILITLLIAIAAFAAAFAQEAPEKKPERKTSDAQPKAKIDDLVAKEDDPNRLVPLEELKPEPMEAELINKHIIDFGLIASNTYFRESANDSQIFLGFYRPYAKYIYKKSFFVDGRGKYFVNSNLNNSDLEADIILEVLSIEHQKVARDIAFGRRFYTLGSGLLFSNYADGAMILQRHSWGKVKMMALYSAEYPDTCSLSLSGCGATRSPYDILPGLAPDANITDAGRRAFIGGEYVTPSLMGTKASVFGMYSLDLIDEAQSSDQLYAYHPVYFGLVFKGFIVSPQYRYKLESVYQTGISHSVDNRKIDGSGVKGNDDVLISAWAVQSEFVWSIPHPMLRKTIRPNAIAQIALASGDPDKLSVTSPAATNVIGHDNAFYYFGSYSGGLALRPRLSNIMVFRLGGLVRPFYGIYALRDLGAILKFSYYRKVTPQGVISDARATEPVASIGSAVDLNLVYKVDTHINVFYGTGFFFPGAAYPETDANGENGRAAVMVHLLSVTLMF